MTMSSKLRAATVGAFVVATWTSGVSALPAYADTASIAQTATAENGNGPCAHGGYAAGGQTSSCNGGGGQAHAWCADFVGWVWARNGVAHVNDLTDLASSLYDYGRRYNTLHNDPRVGDAVVYEYSASTDWAQHVALVTGVNGNSVTITGGNQGHSSGYTQGIVNTSSTTNWSVGSAPWGQRISGYISPVLTGTPAANPVPSSLPTGTLVKSAAGAQVKVVINGAGLPLAGSDVGPDHYDLGKVVTVDDGPFNAMPANLPDGSVIMDQSGTDPNRYVMVDGVALHIAAADWVTSGYSTRPLMGVPTAWLQSVAGDNLPSGTVVYDQSGQDANRYVVVNGSALHISAAEWTAYGYSTRPLMGVPGGWLRDAVKRPLPDGTVVMDQSGTDPNRFVMLNGAAQHISAAEWTADGYYNQALMGVPGEWLASVNKTNRALAAVESGTLHDVYPAADGWHDNAVPNVGGNITAASLAYDATGNRSIAVVESGTLHDVYSAADGWHDNAVPNVGGNISAVSMAYGASGNRVIEVVESGTLHEVYSAADGWHDNAVPNVGGNISAVSMAFDASGNRVIEVVESGTLHDVYSAADGWHDNAVPNVGGNISAVSMAFDASGNRVIEVVESGTLHEVYSAADGWHDNAVPNVGGNITAVSAMLHPSGNRVIEVVESGTLHEVYPGQDGWHDNTVPGTSGPASTVSAALHL
ncbi:CHAP domain-containing protein [Kitasatospora sp. NPDC004669]|uniref:CHAP domain-containing protein n=1 Tax=Kitasatospora sp. NPDC004669 TaxID=3154555 RepID=UPI0033A56DBC